ncbi:MAG TPA: SDR family oxidoreductase [Bacteroidales bacterium]|nr:SDR family oxidoreductase [Bacteroidales bacterium]HPR12044.1 SDR family oxidoreductase [Bacteroidales bacterium]
MNIVITGGTRGIGKEIALLTSESTDNLVMVTGRNGLELEKMARGAVHGNIVTFISDISKFEDYREEFVYLVKQKLGHVDILINMAGMLVVTDFMDIEETKAREMMETNFFGPASVIRALRPLMKNGSHIVNISSMGGFQGSSKYRGLSYYSASKAAISTLSECLALEFSDAGISVNCLALGSVQTEMFERAFPGHKAPVDSKDMARFIADFAFTGGRYFNGKVLPVASSNP